MKNSTINEFSNKTHKTITLFINILGLGLLIFFLISRLIFDCSVSMDEQETVIFSHPSIISIILIPLSLFIIKKLCPILNKFTSRNIFIFCSIIYILLGSILIMLVSSTLRADALSMQTAALQINNGNYTSLSFGSYLFRYPHQLGFTSFLRLLLVFSKSSKIIFFFNLLCTILINYYIHKITHIWFKKDSITKASIILSFLFLPQFFFILFAYGLLMGFMFMIISLYWYSLFRKTKSVLNLSFCVFFSLLSIAIKSNFLIAFIAIILCELLYFLKEKNMFSVILISLLLIVICFTQKGINLAYSNISGHTFTNSEPKLLWIAMGMQEGKSCSGWNNAFNLLTFEGTNFNVEESKNIAIYHIQTRLKDFSKNPGEAVSFYKRKIISTWNDPLFQSIWSGPLPKLEQACDNSFINNIYSGGTSYRIIHIITYVIIYDIILFALIYLLSSFKQDNKNTKNKRSENHRNDTVNCISLFAIIYLLGGFLFHILWETKSQYVYTYIYTLLPISAKGLHIFIMNADKICYPLTKSFRKNK